MDPLHLSYLEGHVTDNQPRYADLLMGQISGEGHPHPFSFSLSLSLFLHPQIPSSHNNETAGC